MERRAHTLLGSIGIVCLQSSPFFIRRWPNYRSSGRLWAPRVCCPSGMSPFKNTLNLLSFVKIFAARPMFPQIQTSPLAGSRLTSHLRALLLLFATYIPPPTSLNTAARPSSDRATRVPEEILTDTLVEEIKTRFCFVGDAIGALEEARREFAPAEDDDESDAELPPSSDPLAPESESSERAESEGPPTPVARAVEDPSESHLQRLAALYKRYSTATDSHIKVVPPSSHPAGTGRGTLVVPGWIRERAAEVLFEGGDVDESSVAEVLLETLLKVRMPYGQVLLG